MGSIAEHFSAFLFHGSLKGQQGLRRGNSVIKLFFFLSYIEKHLQLHGENCWMYFILSISIIFQQYNAKYFLTIKLSVHCNASLFSSMYEIKVYPNLIISGSFLLLEGFFFS